MAKGDVKPIKSNYHSGHFGGGGNSYYDDEGRGKSKQVWEWFEENFNKADDKKAWLMGQEDKIYHWMLKSSVVRYGLMDIAYHWTPGWAPGDDTRAHRLVISKLQEKDWNEFHAYALAAYNRHKEAVKKQEHEDAVANQAKWAAYEVQREAQAAKELENDMSLVSQVVELTAGTFSTDMALAFKNSEKFDSFDGDFIDAPVDVITNSGGWGSETKHATGVKLQITVWLDLSNSMYYNGVHRASGAAFRDLSLALAQLEKEYQGNLFFTYGYWSEDSYSAGAGKKVTMLKTYEQTVDMLKNQLDTMRPSQIEKWYGIGPFDGTDTWISPLLASIAKWESEYSDPGACRLDVILTDAVLEHAADIRAADMIQTKRNGNLSTVLLNFMPEEEWLKTRLPARCYQLHVDKDTVGGIMRNLIAEFVTANM